MTPDELGRQIAAALDELVELEALCHRDPAARRAHDAVRLTAHTLRLFWRPTLEADRAAARQ